MLQLTGAGKRFGPKLLFEGLDWLITGSDHIGLVGGNGTGKSTLLKVVAGIEELDYGSIQRQKGMSAGYLPQDGLSLTGRTVFEECLTVFDRLRQMQREQEHLTQRLGEIDPLSEEFAQIGERLHEIDGELAAHDVYTIESQVGSVLDGLGFRKEDWVRRTEEFSGGWQMRIALAKLLLEKPDLLLLDEPTNHLDLEARNWLESYLKTYPNSFLLISHDRYFLDVTVNKICEVWNKKVWFYHGNYEKYLDQKTERKSLLEAAYRNQQERIEQLEAFINRFRYQATKAKQVQSRIKELEKIERIEIPPEEKTIHFRFPQPKPSGRIVAEFHGVSKAYGHKPILHDVDFLIERGDRIALVGVNGAGKSTLIKLLSGAEPLSHGDYKLGHNVNPDYFAQDQYKELDPDARILDDLATVAPPKSGETELRNILGCFLFSEDDVFKRIGVLSGGERNRYALARMLLQPSNFLLLDEPTNHLDMRAKDVLLKAMQDFEGTLVFVSHDRYFLDHLPTRVFEVAGGEVNIYPGNYAEYLWAKEGKPVDLALNGAASATTSSNGNGTNGHTAAAVEPKKRVNPMKVKKLQERATTLEQEVAGLESDVAALGDQFANFVSADETARVGKLLEQKKQLLEQRMQEWEQVSADIEQIEA